MNEDLESVMGRIAKLLKLAENNTNENEAALAAQKAQDLLVAYNLDVSAIERDDGNRGSAKREDQKYDGGLYQYQRDVWSAVAELNFCLYWNQRVRVVREIRQTGWDGQIRKVSKRGFKFQHRLVGRSINVIATRNMVEYLLGAIERLTRERLHGDGSQFFTKWAVSYRAGMADRIIEKIQDRRREYLQEERRRKADANRAARAAGKPAEGMGTALTLSTYIDEETDANMDFLYGVGWSAEQARKRAQRAAERAKAEAEYTEWAKNNPEEARKKEKEKSKRARTSYGRSERGPEYDSSAYYSGYDKGDSVSLDQQVSNGDQGRLK